MKEKTTHGSWRGHVHTTFRFLGRLKHKINKKWDKILSEAYDLISPDHSPPSSPPPPTYAAPSFPHPVPPSQQPAARPFPQPAPPWYTGQHDHEASGSNQNSNQNSEYFDSVDRLVSAGQHQIQPDYYNAQFHPSFVGNAAQEAQQGEPVWDELGPTDDLLDNEHYFSGELVFSESAVMSQVTETETTTIQQEISIDAVESMEREAVMDTGASPAVAGINRFLLALPGLRVRRGFRRVVWAFRLWSKVRSSQKTKGKRPAQLYRANTKRLRIVPAPSEPKCKGIKKRENGKWCAEIRVSMTNVKVWLGTYATMAAAKLAYDAGLHHCTEKEKPFHFKHLVHRLSPSIYQHVRALCHGDAPQGKQHARSKVKDFAQAHAQLAAHCNH